MAKVVNNQPVVIRQVNDNGKVVYQKINGQDYTKRSDYLPADTLNLSNAPKAEDEGVVKSTCKTIGNGVKSFVNTTVNAFVKATSEVLVDKALGKLSGK